MHFPGSGPSTAQKIVDYRNEHGPFTSVDDLDAIPGSGRRESTASVGW